MIRSEFEANQAMQCAAPQWQRPSPLVRRTTVTTAGRFWLGYVVAIVAIGMLFASASV